MNNILIVYFSYTGNTKIVANEILKAVKADILEIKMEIPYSSNYEEAEAQANKEIKSGYHPAITTKCENFAQYNYVIVATPNWFNTMAPAVGTFLENHTWENKIILPVCTNGGGGLGHVADDIKKLCPNAKIKESLVLFNNGKDNVQTKISNWLSNNLKH